MIDTGNHDGGERDDDVVAAEYVLGVLPDKKRNEISRRIETDRTFAMLVIAWEEYLSSLNNGYGEAKPPAGVWKSLEARLFTGTVSAGASSPSIWQSLAFWRAVSLSSIAVGAVLAAFILTGLPQTATGPELVASLSAEGSDAGFVAVTGSGGSIRVTRTGSDAPSDSSHELWVIVGESAPVSLGVLANDTTTTTTTLPADLAKLPDGALTLAVTLEPLGGSPTGVATGPVIAAGLLKKI
jgi:anti-sigma-K factor RskA